MNIAMSLQGAEGHDLAVLELANEYWLQPHRVRVALAEGVDISGKVAHLLIGLRNQRRRAFGYTPEMAAIAMDELLEAIDAQLLFAAEQDITAQEVA